MSPLRFAICAAALLPMAIADSQDPAPIASAAKSKKEYGKVHFRTKVGSFKILGVAGEPAEGRIEVSFTGSMLVTGTPRIETTGALRKEYERKDRQKVVYHGTGKMVIDGKFWGIQWFGRDMSAVWTGFGVARVYGEFDKNLNTGEYWYANKPDRIEYWGTQGLQILNPPPKGGGGFVPRERGGATPQR